MKNLFTAAGMNIFLFCLVACTGLLICPAENVRAEEGHAVTCRFGGVGFTVVSPPGWVNDAESAAQYGVCAMYIPQGSTFDSASAVIYPKATAKVGGDNLEDSSRLQAEHSRNLLNAHWDGAGPLLERAENIASGSKDTFAVWLFNQGAPPNEWEAVAYLPKDEAILMLVLSARSKENRDGNLSALEYMARNARVADAAGER